MRLRLQTNLGSFLIQTDIDRAPRTLRALAALLPMDVQFHSPKVAGSHIYWQAPLLEKVEGAADVMSAPPGTFLYWPERQFLELIYAPLQAETATVSILGRIEDGIEPLKQLGEMVRERHGRALLTGRLSLEDGAPEGTGKDIDARLASLYQLRADLWAACPGEIDVLMRGRGLMHPAGPLFIAESEARGLHETLWRLLRALDDGAPAAAVAFAAGTLCDKAAARLGGFCHLKNASAGVAQVSAALREDNMPVAGVLREAILIAGALSSWLDLQIPWNDVNETVRRVDGGAD